MIVLRVVRFVIVVVVMSITVALICLLMLRTGISAIDSAKGVPRWLINLVLGRIS